jgi:hypothetical protein
VDVMGCNGADEDVGERTIHPEREDGETLGVGTVPPGGMWGTPPARCRAAAHEWYHGVVHDGAGTQAGSARVSCGAEAGARGLMKSQRRVEWVGHG